MSGAFLSYSHLDDRTPPDAPGAKGWIDFFIEQLRYELDVLGLPEALLWRDANKIAEAERFAPKIDAGLREARLLLAVLSRNYVKRPYCLHQGNRMNGRSRGLADEALEVGGVPAGALAAVLERDGRLGVAQQVHRHVLHDGHVGGAVAGPQPGEVVLEHHVQDPVQAVLDPPAAAHRAGEGGGVEAGRAQVVAPLPLDLAAAPGPALDHADHGEAGEGDLARVAPVREQPGHLVADGVAADLDPAVVAVGRLEGVERTRRRVGEEGFDIREGGRAVRLQGREIIAAPAQDGLGDRALGAGGVDRHQGAFQRQAFQERRDGGDLVRLA